MNGRRRCRALGALVLTACLAATLAGCGKKGALEPPEGQESQFPRVYPKPDRRSGPAPAPPPPVQSPTDSLTLPPSQILQPLPQ